jgi:hypothetical protein
VLGKDGRRETRDENGEMKELREGLNGLSMASRRGRTRVRLRGSGKRWLRLGCLLEKNYILSYREDRYPGYVEVGLRSTPYQAWGYQSRVRPQPALKGISLMSKDSREIWVTAKERRGLGMTRGLVYVVERSTGEMRLGEDALRRGQGGRLRCRLMV